MTPFHSLVFVDAADINALHDDTIGKYGGRPGLLDKACPEAKVEAAKNAALYASGEDEEPDLLVAAAYLIVYFVRGHCYVDGNKRTAWLAAVRLFDLNEMRLRGDDPEAAVLIERIATNTADVADMIRWLGYPGRILAATEVPCS